MCGRFNQYRKPHRYEAELNASKPIIGIGDEPLEHYNIAPTSKVLTFVPDGEVIRAEMIPWGFAPWWAQGKRPPAINARAETAATSKFFRDAWSHRAIVPADGWYEWKKDPDNPKIKQPYNIVLRNREPMFFAAIGRFHNSREGREGDGFVIITADSDEGMIDIHDRRPVVLNAETAAHWLDPELDTGEAELIAREFGLLAEEFEWYPVSRAVGNVRNKGPELIERISDPLL